MHMDSFKPPVQSAAKLHLSRCHSHQGCRATQYLSCSGRSNRYICWVQVRESAFTTTFEWLSLSAAQIQQSLKRVCVVLLQTIVAGRTPLRNSSILMSEA
jgi:hypothetical protein